MTDARAVWTLKGITPETREAVRIAARKRGLTIAAWVEETCRTAATEQIKGAGTLPGPTQADMMARLLDLIEAQSARLDALEQPAPAARRSWIARLLGAL